jgi:protein SCO1/2
VHIPTPGDPVPDFKLINQNGKNISLHQYRGQTLLLTLIYTRCPFPDFCPRVSHEFAAIDRQVRADPARYGKTHLLSVSFDPVHDTPKVLRAYGFSSAGSKDPALFKHWEFSAIPASELPTFAGYFALTYKEEGGLITHSLSTVVISPDGKIFRWYHGGDWRASDLLQDIAAAAHPSAPIAPPR